MISVPRISAAVAVYNGEHYIREALESLLSQTFRDLEVIVVDDGSTDRTAEVVEELMTRDRRLRLFRVPHGGAVDAFNFAAEHARGDYLAWLGADDVALRDRFGLQLAVLENDPDVAVVGGAVTVTDASLQPIMAVRYPTDDAGIRALLPTSNPIAAPAALMRKAAYTDLGGVRGAFSGGAEDYDLWLRIADKYRLANLSQTVLLYRVHTGQVSQARSTQMILSMVGAQVAARRRRAGSSDGLDGLTRLSYETLLELEPNTRLLNDSLLMTAAVHATFLATVGNPSAALELVGWAEGIGRGTRYSRTALARAALARGIAAWRMGHVRDTAGAGLAAVAAHPVYVGQMLARALRSSATVLALRGRAGVSHRNSAAHMP